MNFDLELENFSLELQTVRHEHRDQAAALDALENLLLAERDRLANTDRPSATKAAPVKFQAVTR